MQKQEKKYNQDSPQDSPWSFSKRVKMILWEYTWVIFCKWTPKPFNKWRLLVLKIFGAKIIGRPFVHQRARIQIPWNLTMFDKSCIGDRANIYSLGEICLKENVTIAQEAYLCSGTHDFKSKQMNLVTKSIVIEENVFVGARAFILPGVTVQKDAVVGACSVVTLDVEEGTIMAGNPAKFLKKRELM